MKRSAFSRPTYTRRPVVVSPLTRRVNVARITDDGVAIPKREYVRSTALMVAYRSIPCQHCGIADGTVCGAHSNWAEHGKGRGIKADDNRCASLCFKCHSLLDQGSTLSADERRQFWDEAHAKTVRLLVSLGRWPSSVPVPQLERFAMEIRQALREQGPSLTLQRAAADEIAALDARVSAMNARVLALEGSLRAAMADLEKAREVQA